MEHGPPLIALPHGMIFLPLWWDVRGSAGPRAANLTRTTGRPSAAADTFRSAGHPVALVISYCVNFCNGMGLQSHKLEGFIMAGGCC